MAAPKLPTKRKAVLAGLPEGLQGLCEALMHLPSVGPRTAQRMAMHLLQHDREAARGLAHALLAAVDQVGHCERCNTFTEATICSVCADPLRERTQLCIVETPADQAALELTDSYKGQYFVLMGHLSPLDGLGPNQLGFDRLLDRLLDPDLQEVILATNFTPEGEATAHALAEIIRPLLQPGQSMSRPARGLPAGGELEYVDLGTIALAFRERRGMGSADT